MSIAATGPAAFAPPVITDYHTDVAPSGTCRPAGASTTVIEHGSKAAAQLAKLGDEACCADPAALTSATEKLSIGTLALCAGQGLENSMVALMSNSVEATADRANQIRDEVKDRLQEVSEKNRQELKKMEERAKELEKSEESSGCAKVMKTIIDVAKVVATCSTGNFAAATARLTALTLDIVGKDKAAQAFGAIATALGNPIAEAASSVAEAANNMVDEMQRAGHKAKAGHLLADMKELEATCQALGSSNEDAFDQLRELTDLQKQTINLVQQNLESQAHHGGFVQQQFTSQTVPAQK
jgi:ElaB/YqjD/DUF883 family membrane-anchored ribosome-binding protein